jgi:50S ribosomal protein L16 3-hydroxylase
MKRAIHPFPDLITPEEIAGMSLDERIESRLIIQGQGKNKWQLQRGPFKPSTFKKLPKKKWTVLVNGVDRFVPSVHAFLDEFSFIPFWRMDDIMISYAVDQGNVGAHVDNFDVFLVQASGKREWMIEDRPVLKDEFIPNLPVRLLKKFKPTHRWILEAGDILYLPPRFPHHGIAQGDRCMTISVGCRAPSVNEIINEVASNALSRTDESLRYSDPDLKAQQPGEISLDAVKKIRGLLERALLSEEFLSDWLARFTTEPYSDVKLLDHAHKVSAATIAKTLRGATALVRTEGSRMAFVSKRRESISFYVNGECHEVAGKTAALARELANRLVLPISDIQTYLNDKGCQQLLSGLLASGAIIVDV